MRPLDDRLNLRARHRKRQHADAIDFDSRDRRVQRALDKEVPGPLDASEQRLESLQLVIVGDSNPVAGHAREATGFRRCSQGVRTQLTRVPHRASDREHRQSRGLVPVNDEALCGQTGRESLFNGLEVADKEEASVVRDEASRIRTVSNRRSV